MATPKQIITLYGWVLGIVKADMIDPMTSQVTSDVFLEIGADWMQAGRDEPRLPIDSIIVYVAVTPAVLRTEIFRLDIGGMNSFTGKVSTGYLSVSMPQTKWRLTHQARTAKELTRMEASWLGRLKKSKDLSPHDLARLDGLYLRFKKSELTLDQLYDLQTKITKPYRGGLAHELVAKRRAELGLIEVDDAKNGAPVPLLLNTKPGDWRYQAKLDGWVDPHFFEESNLDYETKLAHLFERLQGEATYRARNHVPFFEEDDLPPDLAQHHFQPQS
ncbi:hypothetical protein [Lacticaseibacillus mingshuiensis]|uniref:Uncharacterized protein n=1 Tax=Lacticaseibacillus mingshuiensis TaxID=2799574 RepID=A0ABW4CL08_9LACO|nr:hypothetical protein [Lacticaseibacillus mingshuiensis]